MVPREARGLTSKGDGRQQGKPKSPAKKRKPATPVPAADANEQGAEAIDPDIAVVIKNPLRVSIVAVAFQRSISPSEFAKEFDCPRWSAAYHFKELEKHGFLELVEEIPVRGSTKHMYRATKRAYISAQDWRLVAPTIQPGIAGAALRDLTKRVEEALETGTFCARPDAYLLWSPLTLDEEAWTEFVKMMAWAYDEAKKFEIESVERIAAKKSSTTFPATFIIAGFESPTTKKVQKRTKPPKKAKKSAKTSKRERASRSR